MYRGQREDPPITDIGIFQRCLFMDQHGCSFTEESVETSEQQTRASIVRVRFEPGLDHRDPFPPRSVCPVGVSEPIVENPPKDEGIEVRVRHRLLVMLASELVVSRDLMGHGDKVVNFMVVTE